MSIILGYIDPGAGSYLLQILVAGLLGGVYLIKLWWVRLQSFVFGLFSRRAK